MKTSGPRHAGFLRFHCGSQERARRLPRTTSVGRDELEFGNTRSPRAMTSNGFMLYSSSSLLTALIPFTSSCRRKNPDRIQKIEQEKKQPGPRRGDQAVSYRAAPRVSRRMGSAGQQRPIRRRAGEDILGIVGHGGMVDVQPDQLRQRGRYELAGALATGQRSDVGIEVRGAGQDGIDEDRIHAQIDGARPQVDPGSVAHGRGNLVERRSRHRAAREVDGIGIPEARRGRCIADEARWTLDVHFHPTDFIRVLAPHRMRRRRGDDVRLDPASAEGCGSAQDAALEAAPRPVRVVQRG